MKLENRAQRNLSILGRSLVANSFIMSPIWQTIRLLALLQSFFLTRVCSFVIKYISQKSFLAINFQPYQCPRKEGGIALIGLGSQHAVLQLCWIQPLLLSSGDKPLYDTFVTEILRHCQSHFSYTVSHLLPLLLPDHQSTTVKSLGCFKTLFATIDKIDYELIGTPLSRAWPMNPP